jgi:two-component system response regulator PhoP
VRILIVEDDTRLLEQLSALFERQGFVVDRAPTGKEGLYGALELPIDVAVVDLGLPDLPGTEVIRKARAAGKKFPVLILTARGRWQEKVEGLESGADDYLVKPFQPEELFARIRALLRRSGGWAQPVLSCGPLSLDPSKGEVLLKGKPLELTAFEYKVLEYLVLHAGEVVSKGDLTEHIYADDADRDSNVIEVFIRRLRQKLDPTGKAEPIETLRQRGYRLVWERK